MSLAGVCADVAQSAEHPPCKRAVMGSIPIVGFRCELAFGASDDPELELATAPKLNIGRLPKWPKGTDCKSVVRRLRRFESFTAHLCQIISGTTTEAFSAARSALIAQLVEHTLGKGEVTGSSPVEGSVAE